MTKKMFFFVIKTNIASNYQLHNPQNKSLHDTILKKIFFLSVISQHLYFVVNN